MFVNFGKRNDNWENLEEEYKYVGLMFVNFVERKNWEINYMGFFKSVKMYLNFMRKLLKNFV